MITKVREFLALRRRIDAIDTVYNTLDDLLLDGKIDEVRSILATIPLDESLPLSIYLSILTVTKPWRHALIEREAILLYCSNKMQVGSL